MLKKLTELGCPKAALTGISLSPDKIGVYSYDSLSDKYFYYANEKLPNSYHGTGDIYASAVLGALMRGISLERSLSIAVDFTLDCMKKTEADPNRRFYGVNFESALGGYNSMIENEVK